MKGREWYQADEIAAGYDDKRFTGGGRLIDAREKELVMQALGPVQDRKILEIACGTGRFTSLLAGRGAEVVGFDISSAMIRQGRERIRQTGVADRVNFVEGDAARLPFPDDYFDAVLAMRFFHLAETPQSFLAEMRRVVRDQIVFDTFNRLSARQIYNWALPMGSHLYSRRDIEELLSRTDLSLNDQFSDFLFPYGFYRQLPDSVARVCRFFEAVATAVPSADKLQSVTVWDARVTPGP